MSFPRAIPIFWTGFYHVVRMSLADFFSLYVNMAVPKVLDITVFSFSLMVVSCCPMPNWMLLLIPLPPPLLEWTYLPLAIVVDCC